MKSTRTLSLLAALFVPTGLIPLAMPVTLGAHEQTKTDATAPTFVCPMHPEVTAPRPDACPKCGKPPCTCTGILFFKTVR